MSSIIDATIETVETTTLVSFSDNVETSTPDIMPSTQESVSMTATSTVEPEEIKQWHGVKEIERSWSNIEKDVPVHSVPWSTTNVKSLKTKFSESSDRAPIKGDDKKRIQPLDIAEEWVDSENDEILWNAKTTFLELAKRNLKKNNYTMVYRAYDIVDYLSDGSQGFFRMVVDHADVKNMKFARLFEWKIKGKLVYILAIDDMDTPTNKWLDNRLDFYNDVATRGQVEGGKFDKKSYSILRRNCLKDFTNKFTSTWFFKDFETAKRAITMKVDGHVQFLKKDFKVYDDEILDEIEAQIEDDSLDLY